jgi:peptidoglycan hydrolase-like protein with peptidoglycan-binding domain
LLIYPPFAASTQMVNAAKNNPPLRQGSRGIGVGLLQGALIDLNFKLPNSTKKTGRPDGAYGPETERAVTNFQLLYKVGQIGHVAPAPDGVAGKNTLAALDKLMVGKTALKPPVPLPVPPVPPPSLDYRVGVGDPTVKPDIGAGRWNSKPKEATYVALAAGIINILPQASVVVGDDAAKHMAHYFFGNGRDLTIDLEGMVKEVPSARERYEDEVAQAKEWIETLPVGRHTFTSVNAQSAYNYQDESRNWYFAIGGYCTWGKGTAVVTQTAAGRQCEVDFEYKFFDRYNWDGGKSVELFNIEITDEFMAEFHRQGIASEYNCFGAFKRRLAWREGELIPRAQLDRPPGGRQS